MPKIRIADHLNVELISTNSRPASGIAKYFRGDIAGFVASSELVNAINKPISSLGSAPMGFGLSFANTGSFGSTGIEWSVQAGLRSVVSTTQAGEAIRGEDVFGEPILVPAGQTFLGYSFSPTLTLGAGASVGELSFGFNAASTFEYRTGKSFDVAGGAGPSLRDALSAVLSKAAIPGDVADLEEMQPGELCSLSGSGQFRASAQFDLAAAMNPLATPTLGLSAIGALQIKAGASVTVDASVAFSGTYQIRVAKLDSQRVSLGYYKLAASEFRLDVNASAGLSASVGGRDFLTPILSGLSTAPKAEIVNLVDAGLSDVQIAEIQTSIKASIQRSLSLSLMTGFSASSKKEAVFEYEFDLSLLDAAAKEALQQALDGDLSALTARDAAALPPGVKLLSSQLETMRKKSFTWKINLLGIVNVFHLSELIRTGKVLFVPSSGELVITDSVTHKSIFVKTRPFEADAEKLRKVLMQSMVLTAAYRVSGMRNFLGFSCTQSYFDQSANARKHVISDFLDHFVALGLIGAPEKAAFLSTPAAGTASLALDLSLDDAAFRAMLIGASGQPLLEEDYDSIGRNCVLQVIQPGDENDFRRIPMQDDNLWKQMTSLGQFAMRSVMPPQLKGDVAFALVQHDYTVIRWWSAAMSTAAAQVASMLNFLNGADAETLKDNNDFKKKREELAKAVTNIVKNSQPDFLDAWGILAIDAATHNRAVVHATLLTNSSFLVKDRR